MEPSDRGDDDLDPLLARALERMRQYMIEHNISQKDLERATGIKQGQISRLLNGKRGEGNFVQIAKLAMALDLSIDALVAPAPRFGAGTLPPSTRQPVGAPGLRQLKQ